MKTLSYLDNLVARNMPETAVVQPRPVSLFEPLPGTAFPFPAPVTGEAETAVAHAEPAPMPRPQTLPLARVADTPVTAVTPPIAPRRTVQPVLAEPSPPAASQAAKQRGAHTPTLNAPQSLPPIQPTHIPAPSPPSPELAQQRQRPLPTDDALASTKQALSPQPVITPLPMPVAPPYSHRAESGTAKEGNTTVIIREQVALLKADTETPAKTVPTLVEIVREQPVQPLPAPANQPPAAAAHEQPGKSSTPPVVIRADQIKPFTPVTGPPAPQPPVTPPPEPAPTVQITIGRIEVRATPPTPTKVEKKRPQTPVLSLEEYLRQRNGGRP